MSKFEVGKKYKGWCRDCWTTPATLIVVAIAEDRKTLMAVSEKGSDPKRAFTYKVRWDDRFGEKIVTGERGLYNVWRADKVMGDAEIPEGWYDEAAKRRSESAQRAASTRRQKNILNAIRDKMTVEHLAQAYTALANANFKDCHLTKEDLLKRWRENNGSPLHITEARKGRDGVYVLASIGWREPCEPYTVVGGQTLTDRHQGRTVGIYHDRIDLLCGSQYKPIKGEEYKAIFGDII
jgi:hypothetical protein